MIPNNLLQHPMSGKPTWIPGYIHMFFGSGLIKVMKPEMAELSGRRILVLVKKGAQISYWIHLPVVCGNVERKLETQEFFNQREFCNLILFKLPYWRGWQPN